MSLFTSFAEQVVNGLYDLLPNDVTLSLQEVNKTGDKTLTGLCIRSDKTNVAPLIYLDPLFEKYQGDIPISSICDEIRHVYETNAFSDNFDLSVITDWSRIKSQVCTRLINHKRNATYLEKKVYGRIPDTDLSFMYYIILDTFKEGATIPVSHELFAAWNITTDELHETAIANTQRIHQPCVRPMNILMQEMFGCSTPAPETDQIMYVITSKKMLHSAVLALLPEVYEELYEKLGEGFLLLPSSVHEMLAVPQDITDPQDLLKMVTEINHCGQVVSDEDILADDVFTIRDGRLVSIFSEEEKRAIQMQALSFLPFPETELDA